MTGISEKLSNSSNQYQDTRFIKPYISNVDKLFQDARRVCHVTIQGRFCQFKNTEETLNRGSSSKIIPTAVSH